MGEANNFTSYDLLQRPVSSGDTWYVPADFTSFAPFWFVKGTANLSAYDHGQLEYAQVQFTASTLPNRNDTDRDGLNDSEEVNPGSDGFRTNPWAVDTDADGVGDGLESGGWSFSGPSIGPDPGGFRTDPTRIDTDRDGIPDRRDRMPLGDGFVLISILSASVVGEDPHNPGNVTKPFVKATISGNDTYTPYLQNGTGSWNTTWNGETLEGHRLAVDVPDDQMSIDFTVAMWSYDSSGADNHTAIGIAREHFGGECYDVNEVTRTYEIGSVGGSTRYEFAGGCSSLYADPLVVVVSTIAPARVGSRLILPLDYSGVYNVTDSAGSILSRRYVGEPRFVALVLNVTSTGDWACVTPDGCDDAPIGPKVLFIPRSVFHDTFLGKKLADGNKTDVPDNLSFYQNGTGSNNSDALQQVIAGNVTADEYFRILGWLLRNGTGNATNRVVNETGDLFLYSLPDDAIRLVGYGPIPVAKSVSYRFCPPGGCVEPPPPPWWEQIWRGIVIVATFILSGILFVANAFVQLGKILVAVGSWIVRQIVAFIDFVAGALQAAAKALAQVLDWVATFVTNLLLTLLKPILDALEQYLAGVRDTVRAGSVELLSANPSPEEHADRAAELVAALLLGGTFLLFLALALALLAVDVAAKPITTIAGIVVPLLIGVAMGLIFGAVLVGLIPISSADTGRAPDNVDFIPEFVIDFIPADAWWSARAPLTFGRFAGTIFIILVRHFVLHDPIGVARIAESMLLSVTGLILFIVSPQLQGSASLIGTAIGFAFALFGFIRVALGARLKTIAPLVYYAALALAIASLATGGLSLARLG